MLVLPEIPYGVTRYGADFPGAVSISEETLRSLVTEICSGRQRVVLVNSHLEPEQVWTLRELGLPLLDVTRRANAERLTEEFRAGRDMPACTRRRSSSPIVLTSSTRR